MTMSIVRVVFLGAALLPFTPTGVSASLIQYSDRTSFLSAVGQAVTDSYGGYGGGPGHAIQLTDAQMSAVFGETRYQSTTFSDLNFVGDVYLYGDGTDYCAGCNGNFQLDFSQTSLADGGGVFGVGIDIVFHTSRHSSLGDAIPGDTVLPGTIRVELSDGTTTALLVPPDIGFFEPGVFFLGLTDPVGIKSLMIGTEPISQRQTWVIDNLTIAAAPVPEASALAVLLAGVLLSFGFAVMRAVPTSNQNARSALDPLFA